MPSSSSTNSLDYNKCTPTELRAFIRNRSSLKPSDSEELGHFRKSHLMARLEMLDKYSRFRFLDLPPELRLEVYQYILIARNRDALEFPRQVIETALLLTCKLIYKEAAPVLYGENEFTVGISFPPNSWSGSWDSLHTCSPRNDRYDKGLHCIEIARPGRPKNNYECRGFRKSYGPLDTHVASCTCFKVLRQIRHLTLFFSSGPYGASRVFAALCTMLSGASQIVKLTVVLDVYWVSGFDITRLASTFWCVALLRGDVELEIKSEVDYVTAELAEGYDILCSVLEQYCHLLRSEPYRGLKPPGDMISEARKREASLIKADREDLRYLHHIEVILDELVRWFSTPKILKAFYIPIEAWSNLQSYVNENEQSLRSLNKTWKNACAKDAQLSSRFFPSWYAESRKRRRVLQDRFASFGK